MLDSVGYRNFDGSNTALGCIKPIHGKSFLIQSRASDTIRRNMNRNDDFEEILGELRSILSPYLGELVAVKDGEAGIYLETIPTSNSTGEFFAAAEIKKNYVSFHFMPVYCFPDLCVTASRRSSKSECRVSHASTLKRSSRSYLTNFPGI
jgi:hypothetical protein